jgi:sirohydrochlorin cobaltochelatase
MQRATPIANARPGDAVVLLGHGSRDPAGNAPVHALAEAVAARLPDASVSAAFVELTTPLLDDALAAVAHHRRVTVVPTLLFTAGHVKNDLPLSLTRARTAFPITHFAAAPPLGAAPELIAAARAHARAAAGNPARTALVVVGRGSSDPDANGELYRVARLIGEGDPWASLLPAFAGVAAPDLPAALELAARARPDRIVVVPYLLFPGRVLTRLADQVAAFAARTTWIPAAITPPLGADAVVAAVVDRALATIGGGRDLACDACQYRVPIAGAVEKVGGLKALLYSVRHQVTHGQAAPHVHAHRPLEKHVLVCGNADCADRGSVELATALRHAIKDAGKERTIRVTRTSCLGRCGEGPTVAVYPDGVWYRGVRASDAAELVSDHLLADRLVARLVDNVLS